MTNRFLLLAICILSFVNTHAQASKKEVESSIEALNKATIAQDKQSLEKITEDALTYGHSTGAIQDKSSFIRDILTGPSKFAQIENADQTISLVSDLAIVRNVSTITGTKDGAPLNIKIGVLMVWKKEGADWKLLVRQGYKLP